MCWPPKGGLASTLVATDLAAGLRLLPLYGPADHLLVTLDGRDEVATRPEVLPLRVSATTVGAIEAVAFQQPARATWPIYRRGRMKAGEQTPGEIGGHDVPGGSNPPREGKGCRGCLLRGCGCFGIFVVITIVWVLWPGFFPQKPLIGSVLPPSTVEVRYTERLETLFDRHGLHMPTGLLQPLVDEAALTKSQAESVARVRTTDGTFVVFSTAEARPAIERLSRKEGYTSATVGDWTVLTSSGDRAQQISWFAVNARTLVAGTPEAVTAVLRVISEQQGDLLEARPYLKPILHTLGNEQSFFVTLQEEGIMAEAEVVGDVLEELEMIPPFIASLFSMQALGGSSEYSASDCTFVLASQYGDPAAAFVVSRFSKLGSIIHFFADKNAPHTPNRRSVDRSGRLVATANTYSKEKCDRMDETDNRQHKEHVVRW